MSGQSLNPPPVNAVPTEIKVVNVKINAVAWVAVAVLTHALNTIAFPMKSLELVDVKELVETCAYGGAGIGKIVRHGTLLKPGFEVKWCSAAEILVDFSQLLSIVLHLLL